MRAGELLLTVVAGPRAALAASVSGVAGAEAVAVPVVAGPGAPSAEEPDSGRVESPPK